MTHTIDRFTVEITTVVKWCSTQVLCQVSSQHSIQIIIISRVSRSSICTRLQIIWLSVKISHFSLCRTRVGLLAQIPFRVKVRIWVGISDITCIRQIQQQFTLTDSVVLLTARRICCNDNSLTYLPHQTSQLLSSSYKYTNNY